MDVTDNLRDAAYITIGAAVIGINKAQVARREAIRRFEPQVEEGRQAVAKIYTQLEPQLEEGRQAVAKIYAQLRENLTVR
jgi:predicted SnoaL-like aldol condensation-catalyzing enzyme